jgi:peptidoglycan/LPS O-acetylase OafA/YrhL
MKPFLAALVAALAITYVSLGSHRILDFLGAISYSLYLLHVPIGGRVINLAARLDLGMPGKVAAIAAAALASVGAAYVLYRLVEVPALRWARKLNWAPR